MEQQYVEAFKSDDNRILKELYNANRASFLNFTNKYKMLKDDAVDVYQEAFIIVRSHAISGKLDTVKCSLKTYLFGIGKHLVYKKLQENSVKTIYDASQHIVDHYDEIVVEPQEELTEEQLLLKHFFIQLGKSCQHVLTLAFYRGLTNEEIAEIGQYESEAVVRSQKSRCLKTLKNLILNSKKK